MHDDGYFGPEVAARYDNNERSAPEHVDPAVDLLVALAAGGAALEFAIGTGRIALPLSQRGVAVEGIELSRAMVARLREKENSQPIPVTIGDMATTRIEGRFALVYLVFNTISNLTTQDAQVACFENAAAHLAPGGRFVIEMGVPALRTLPPGKTLRAFSHGDSHWGIDAFDVANQHLTSHHVWLNDDGSYDRFAVPFRYAWPAEFDLMARIAGMTLENRWSGWKGEPFDSESESHVSVWRKA